MLRAIHERNCEPYPFPDFLDAEFVDAQVVTDENDVPVMLAASRKTVEEFLLVDRGWRTPRWRMAAFAQLHEAVRVKLKELGYRDAHCWPYPEVEKSFAKRLRLFGWAKSRWNCYSRSTS